MKTAWTIILFLAAVCLTFSALASVNPIDHFPIAWVDRDKPPERIAELRRVVTEAVSGFTARERAAVLAIGGGESAWAEFVLFDCRDRPADASGDCDRGKARTYWQLHDAACPELRGVAVGSVESVRIGADCARRRWGYAMKVCRGNVEQSFAQYGGRRCGDTTKSTAEKLRWFRRMGGGL